MSEWVSVEDGLPEIDKTVIGFDGSHLGIYQRVYIDHEGWFWGICYNIYDDAEVDDDYKVTHWMPLPEPPKGVGDE
jgi:hypothetical protein